MLSQILLKSQGFSIKKLQQIIVKLLFFFIDRILYIPNMGYLNYVALLFTTLQMII